MSTNASDAAPTPGCLTLGAFFYLICVSAAATIHVVNTHGNFASFLFFITPSMLFFVLILFFLSPWGRLLLRRHPASSYLPYLFIIAINWYLDFSQYSLASPHTIFGIFMSCVILFMFTPWFKHTRRWFPKFLIVLTLIGGVLILEPIVTHPPINYVQVVLILLVVCGAIAILLLFLRYSQNSNVREEGITLRVGRVNIPQEEAPFEEQPQTIIRFLGISISFTRSGKFWKLTLSTD